MSFFFFFHIGDIASMDYRQRLQSISTVSTAAVTCVYGRNHFLRMTWALVVLCIKGSNTTSSLVNATILWSSIIFLLLAAGVNTSIHQVGAALAPHGTLYREKTTKTFTAASHHPFPFKWSKNYYLFFTISLSFFVYVTVTAKQLNPTRWWHIQKKTQLEKDIFVCVFLQFLWVYHGCV